MLGDLPPCVQLLARARFRLPQDVTIEDHPADKEHKKDELRVNLTAAWQALTEAIRAHAAYAITHAYAVDASKVEKTTEAGESYIVVARAAARHDGTVLRGRLLCDDEFLSIGNTTYLAEKAACDDALADAPPGARIMLWLDSSSHAHALQRFMHTTARRRRNVHAAGRHRATERLLQPQELVLFHWQMSHVGEPMNEWADQEADVAADEEIVVHPPPACFDFASMLFARDVRGERHLATSRADAEVARRLRSHVQNTILRSTKDLVLKGLPEDDERLLSTVLAERCFYSDAGLKLRPAERRVIDQEALCPFGCGVACTWYHFCFKCQGPPVVERRELWLHHVEEAGQAWAGEVPHAALDMVREWLVWSRPSAARYRQAPRHGEADAALTRTSGALAQARGFVGGLFDPGTTKASGQFKAALANAISAGAELIRGALVACEETWGERLKALAISRRVFRRYATKLRDQVRKGGPRRAALLAHAADVRDRARTAGVGLGWAAEHAAAWARCREAAADDTLSLHMQWWLAAKVLRARLRAWTRLGWVTCRAAGRGWDARVLTVTGAALPARQIDRGTLVDRASSAMRRAVALARPARVRDGAHAHRAEIRAMARFVGGGTVHGGELRDVRQGALHITAGRCRVLPGEAKRARAATGRRVRRGQEAGRRDEWSTRAVLDVRRRTDQHGTPIPGRALEALIEWEGDWPHTWVPVNPTWIPSAVLRREVRDMYSARQGQRAALAVPTERALARAVRGSTAAARRTAVDPGGVDEIAQYLADRESDEAPIVDDASDDGGDGGAFDGHDDGGALDDGHALMHPSVAGLRGTVDATANGGDGRDDGVDAAANGGDDGDDLTRLLAARQQHLDADASMRVQVEAIMAARMDVGVRVNASLAHALGVRAGSSTDPLPNAVHPSAAASAAGKRPRHPRLQSDVDLVEEAEVRRLEGGAADDRDAQQAGAAQQVIELSDSEDDAEDPPTRDEEELHSALASRLAERAGAAVLYAQACAQRDEAAAGDDDWRALHGRAARLRRTAEAALERAGHMEPLRAQRCNKCPGCATPCDVLLCPPCTARALGWTDEEQPPREALDAFCAQPSVARLLALLTDADVCGDGSCWSYAALASGRMAHASASGERLGRPTRAQCVHDRALRHAVVEWCERNDGYFRLCGGAARDVAKLKDLAQRPPIYGAGSSGLCDYLDGPLLRAGSYGGDMQWVAVSDLLSCDIFTYDAAGGGDVEGSWYEHGEVAEGRRGRWCGGTGARARTLSAAVAHCITAGSRLLVLQQRPQHWHALLPRGAGGSVTPLASVEAAIAGSRLEHAIVDIATDELTLESLH